MKNHLNNPFKARYLLGLALMTGLALPFPSLALGPLILATQPLANATTTTVLPNLMFVLDDSGSMGSNFAPDYTSGAANILFNNNTYNGMYYSPAIKYLPPAFFDASGLNTTTYPSQTGTSAATGAGAGATPNWKAVKDDGYGVESTSTSNLVSNASFYTFQAGEYCTAIDLKSCVAAAAPSVPNPFPGALRWCNSAGFTNCKANRTLTGSYTFPRYPVQSQTTINVTASSGNLPVTGITVSGKQIMSGATAGSNTTSTVASNIAAAINNCTMTIVGNCTTVGFSATANSSTVTILAPAPTTVTLVMAVTPSNLSRTSITLTSASSTPQVTGIVVSGKQIMSVNSSGTTNTTSAIATEVVNAINACTLVAVGTCTVAGYSASRNVSTITIVAPTLTSATPTMSINSGTLTPNTISAFVPDGITSGIAAFAPGNAIPGSELFTTIDPSVASYPFPGTAAKSLARTDCAGATCTYAEEMTNYANWWTYYQTRIQAMKTGASLAFKPIDTRFRVGYNTISYTGTTNGTKFLEINPFDTAQKASWYGKFFAATVGSSTPLRSAISKIGRLFAHKMAGAADPMQYSCQQNFMLMTTDGYWNLGSETSTYGPFALDGSTAVGNMDSASTLRSAGMYEGPTASSASLADLARYYYVTDLRTSALGNCTGALGGAIDVCANNVFVSGTDNNTRQHMTTFTLGLGVDGVLQYQADYNTATSGDFYNLKNGLGTPTANWPDPDPSNSGNTVESRIDDLWHAAVNGQGQYFSAKDPAQLTAGLSAALKAIGAKVGAGAAAATSTLNPVAGDNSAYVASYTSQLWSGNLESRAINIITGQVSDDATWCAEDVVASSCAAPGTIVANTSGSSTTYTCDTGGATAATCAAPGVLVGTTCKVDAPTSCIGTMAAKVASSTDTRTIYTKVGTGLGAFTYANLTGGQQTNFNTAFLAANLSQWSSLSAGQQTAAAGVNLVNFLRGQKGFEMSSLIPANQLYRSRTTVMADALESKPAFIGKPTFSYLDPGYAAFKTSLSPPTARAGTVYIGTNEGMLHAFDSATGNERWAYVPSMVIPNMWKLADIAYQHANYVNGDSIVSDICSANCTNAATAVWKTILVAGLNGGGKGYFALDITVPNAPVLLWEFDTTTDNDLGYSFGNPVITKKTDGTWVVLFTSGYNNTTGSNPGRGFLYVVNAATGSVISKMPTGVGSAAAPSGLAKITAFAPDAEKDNTATFTYGGDLSGNVWRFDINAAASGTNPLKLATLFSDAAGTVPQPVTTRPELGLVKNKRVVFVGTGKYLETSDLTDTQLQTLYAIKDDDATTTLVNPRTTLVQQTITGTSATRRINSPQPVDFATGNGWFVNFPDGATALPVTSSERQNVGSQLVAGTLLVPTTVPSNTVCAPGGYGWLNFFNYATGGPVTTSGTGANVVSARTNAPIVGINVLYVPDTSSGAAAGAEKPVVSVVTSDQPTPQLIPAVPFVFSFSAFQGKRVIWRELTN